MENLSSNSEEPKKDSNGCDQSSKTLMLGKRKKKQKEVMHVETSAQSSKIVKKRGIAPTLIKVLSDQASKSASSKPVKSLKKTCAMIRAEEVISAMDPRFPTLLRTMVRTHVSTCFLMGLYKPFCISHLPKKDTTVTVEDESGKEFQMKYLFQRTALSGGWRNFAITQTLLEGDVVIFQVVQPLEPVKLKVYIVRANSEATKDGAPGGVNFDAHKQQDDADKGGSEISHKSLSKWATKGKRAKSLQPGAVKKKKGTGLGESVSKTSRFANKSKIDEEEIGVEIIGGRSYPPSQVQFEDVKCFKDFTIMVDDLCIDSELADDIRHKYYELCVVKKAFLHARLMQGLNSKFISGMIYETVNIADLIKTCDLTTCRSEFANWERALKSFHFMGMGVGFMIARIRKLVGIAFESEDALKSRKYMEAKLERIRAEDEIVNLKSRFVELKETYKKCGGDVMSLKSKTESFKHKFQEEVNAPW